MKIKYHNLYLFIIFPFIAILMYLVSDTDADRYAYIELFSNPFNNSRIEPLFQYYMYIYHILSIPPEISTIITILIIYSLFVKIWFENIQVKSFESFLIINFILFSFYNYYLGTSIRMGLAMAISLYSYFKIEKNYSKNKYFYLILMFLSIFIHYGTALFFSIFILKKFFHFRSQIIDYVIIIFLSIFLIYGFFPIISLFNINSYYLQYIYNGFGNAEHIIPYTIISYILFLFFVFPIKHKNFNMILSLYGIPFIILQLTFKLAFIGKILMPLLFILVLEIYNKYWKQIKNMINKELRFYLLILLNIIAILYALKRYHYY